MGFKGEVTFGCGKITLNIPFSHLSRSAFGWEGALSKTNRTFPRFSNFFLVFLYFRNKVFFSYYLMNIWQFIQALCLFLYTTGSIFTFLKAWDFFEYPITNNVSLWFWVTLAHSSIVILSLLTLVPGKDFSFADAIIYFGKEHQLNPLSSAL